MNKAWYYISYPIRLLLRRKVERYRKLLKGIEERQKWSDIKARRKGSTDTTLKLIWADIVYSEIYKRFIKRWEI